MSLNTLPIVRPAVHRGAIKRGGGGERRPVSSAAAARLVYGLAGMVFAAGAWAAGASDISWEIAVLVAPALLVSHWLNRGDS